jgi:hypothetical protein
MHLTTRTESSRRGVNILTVSLLIGLRQIQILGWGLNFF